MLLKCQHRRTFWRKPRLQNCPQCRVLADLAKTPKSAIFLKFFKVGTKGKSQKRRPTLEARKSPRRKRRYLLINMHLKCNHRRTFWRKPPLQKCPQCRVLADLAKINIGHFLKFFKGGTKGKSQKKEGDFVGSNIAWAQTALPCN